MGIERYQENNDQSPDSGDSPPENKILNSMSRPNWKRAMVEVGGGLVVGNIDTGDDRANAILGVVGATIFVAGVLDPIVAAVIREKAVAKNQTEDEKR